MRFPKTIDLDNADSDVFPWAANVDEWAISGAFTFADLPQDRITGQSKQAFAGGFLGIRSFGWSRYVRVAEIGDSDYEAVVGAIADRLIDRRDTKDHAAALLQARREAEFAASLCDHQLDTLIAVQRSFGTDGIVERFRIVVPINNS